MGTLRPCVVYSGLTSGGAISDTLAQAYLDASTLGVLRQGKILLSAAFEALLLGVYPTAKLVAILLLLCGSVVGFTVLESQPQAQQAQQALQVHDLKSYHTALMLIAASVASASIGTI